MRLLHDLSLALRLGSLGAILPGIALLSSPPPPAPTVPLEVKNPLATYRWEGVKPGPLKAVVEKLRLLSPTQEALLQGALANHPIDPLMEIQKEKDSLQEEGDGPGYASYYNEASRTFRLMKAARSDRDRLRLVREVEAEIRAARDKVLREATQGPVLVRRYMMMDGYAGAANAYDAQLRGFPLRIRAYALDLAGPAKLVLPCEPSRAEAFFARLDPDDYVDLDRDCEAYVVVTQPRIDLEFPRSPKGLLWRPGQVVYASDRQKKVFGTQDLQAQFPAFQRKALADFREASDRLSALQAQMDATPAEAFTQKANDELRNAFGDFTDAVRLACSVRDDGDYADVEARITKVVERRERNGSGMRRFLERAKVRGGSQTGLSEKGKGLAGTCASGPVLLRIREANGEIDFVLELPGGRLLRGKRGWLEPTEFLPTLALQTGNGGGSLRLVNGVLVSQEDCLGLGQVIFR